MVCANPHSLVIASRDHIFFESLNQASIVIPDGEGIIIAARILNLPIQKRVTGSDFFLGISERLSERGGARFFFLGSTNDVLIKIRERLRKHYPKIEVCGMLSPPFKKQFNKYENTKMVSAINAAHPDVLWVGMTAPKQEKWIFENRHDLKVPFIGAIGAVFDFFSGNKQRPSIFWQDLGLEWLSRFFREPRRLLVRNLKSTPIFIYWLVRERIKRRFFTLY